MSAVAGRGWMDLPYLVLPAWLRKAPGRQRLHGWTTEMVLLGAAMPCLNTKPTAWHCLFEVVNGTDPLSRRLIRHPCGRVIRQGFSEALTYCTCPQRMRLCKPLHISGCLSSRPHALAVDAR